MISLFCKHKWEVHSKNTHELNKITIAKGTEHWYFPALEHNRVSETVEILICIKCGEFKQLVY